MPVLLMPNAEDRSALSNSADLLAFARDETRTVLSSVLQKKAATNLRGHPLRYSEFLWSLYSGIEPETSNEVNQGANYSIRKIHDFYGWMAKPGRIGLCSGAIYRSLSFLELPSSARKGRRGEDKNIHIEHLVPVSVLCKVMRAEASSFSSPSQLHNRLLEISICVAITQDEERLMREAQVPSSRSPSFDDSGRHVGDLPFQRYRKLQEIKPATKGEFRVFNVITGGEVDFGNFTFDMHATTLLEASQQFFGSLFQPIFQLG